MRILHSAALYWTLVGVLVLLLALMLLLNDCQAELPPKVEDVTMPTNSDETNEVTETKKEPSPQYEETALPPSGGIRIQFSSR